MVVVRGGGGSIRWWFVGLMSEGEELMPHRVVKSEEKASNMMDKASDVAHSAQDSMQQGGQQMKEKAQGAADSIKSALNSKN
ncbi:uncharacterized protein HKW66_Vig0150330 [Vigna angularis]|uniref:Stress-induced protein KIN2-like n=1 Tax=Phaseolus angularis TaxID=3914 RepID=A0A8T0JUK2_PHAAN|nr:uncharacterized protein HKW66_Vig0150330 [Vigna angularis]